MNTIKLINRMNLFVSIMIIFLGFNAVNANSQDAEDIDCFAVADDGDLLFLIDIDTPSLTNLGEIMGDGIIANVDSIESIVIDPLTNTLYGAAEDELIIIDQNTVQAMIVAQDGGDGRDFDDADCPHGGVLEGIDGDVTFDDVDSLAYDPINNIFYGAERQTSSGGGEDQLFAFDPTSGCLIQDFFGPGIDYVDVQPQAGLADIDDLAFDVTGNRLLGIANQGPTQSRLVEIDTTDGSTVDLGLINFSGVPLTDIEGMGVTPDGRIFVTTGNQSNPPSQQNNLYELTMIQAGNVTASFVIAFNPLFLDVPADIEAFSCFSIPVVALPASTIPTLSEWGLIAMAGLLGIIGFLAIRRRKAAV